MKIADLKTNIEKFQSALSDIGTKREIWQNTTKQFIKETLTEIKRTYDLDWNVYVMDNITNWEGVNITFGKQRSGIFERTENGTKSYEKRGGTLAFSQAYNGDIFVIIIYPSVEELVTPKEELKLVVKVSPEKIDAEFIIKHLDAFVREMTLWENSESSSSTLGYK